MTAAIEAQVERFAPGFRDLVLARAVKTATAMEAYDANYVGVHDMCGRLAAPAVLARRRQVSG